MRLALAAAATLALCLAGAAGSRSAAQFGQAQLSVDSISLGGQSLLSVDVQLENDTTSGEAPGLASRIDVTLPTGYALDVSGAPGRTVGNLIGIVASADGSDTDFATAPIVVDDPATWAADPVAQACAPGPHTALWRASPTLVGRPMGVPIAVDSAPDPASSGTAYVVHICPTQAPSAGFPLGVGLIDTSLLFTNTASVPTAAGIYRWSALVTPAAAGSLAPQPSSAFELRAVERRPNALTLHARYEPRTNTAAISGTVNAAGAPWAGADVSFFVSDGTAAPPTSLGSVPTAANGSFFLRIPARQSEIISASVARASHACGTSSAAPGGCLSETDTPPPDVSANVLVPRATDPRQALNGRDQALAHSSSLQASDVPGGVAVSDAPLPCAAFAPNLHGLTQTGAATSEVVLAGTQRDAAFTTASVLRTVADARADFTGVARLAALRCEANQSIANQQGARIRAIGPLHITRIGNTSRAFRAQVVDSLANRFTLDDVFVRVGRVVITVHTYAAAPDLPLDLQLARTLAGRAARG